MEFTKKYLGLFLLPVLVASVAVTTAYISPQQAEASVLSTKKSSLVIKQCIQFKKWFDQGVLSQKLHGNIRKAEFCDMQHPEIWRHTDESSSSKTDGGSQKVTEKRCTQLKQWLDDGTLTDKLKGDSTEAMSCASFYKKIWNK